jgi:hypothetical protein
MTTNGQYSTVQQVHIALDAYLDAHSKAADAAAAYVELKSIVGGNETERKAAKARIPGDEYEGYLMHLAECEHIKVTTAATAERAEKVLNTLRDVLNNETAALDHATAEISARVAERYAGISMAPPARPLVMKPAPDPDEIPF